MFGSKHLSPILVGITVVSACSSATTRSPRDSAPATTTTSATTPATAATTTTSTASSATTARTDTGATTLPSTVPTTTPAPSPAPMPGLPMPATSADTAVRSSVGTNTAAAATSATTTNATSTTGTPSATAATPMGNLLMERQQLRLAVQSLNRARAELQRSTATYGGRKASIVQNIDGALHELRAAGGPDSVNIAETTTEARVEGREIHLAVESLERARREMGSPTYVLGGHRASVLAAIDRALGDLRAAAEYEK